MTSTADILGIVQKPVEQYENTLGCRVQVHHAVLEECFCKIEESLNKNFKSHEAPNGYALSPFKMAGVICFWLRKLKPFSVPDNTEANRLVNETVGFLVGYYFIFQYSLERSFHRPKITAEFFHDVTTSLRYNAHSPNSTAFLFEGLCL